MSMPALDMEPDPVPSKPPPASLVSIAAKSKPAASNKAGDLTRLFELARQEASASLPPVAEPALEPAAPVEPAALVAEAAGSEFLAPATTPDTVEWSTFETVPEPNLSTVVPFELPAPTPLVSLHRDYSENSDQDEGLDLVDAPNSVETSAELAPAPVIELLPAPEISIAAAIDDALAAPEENPAPVLLLSAPEVEIDPPVATPVQEAIEAPAQIAVEAPEVEAHEVEAPAADAQPGPVDFSPSLAYAAASALEIDPAIDAAAPAALGPPEVAAPTYHVQAEPLEPPATTAVSAAAIEVEPAVETKAVEAPASVPAPVKEPAPAAPAFASLAEYWHFLRGGQDFPATETLDHALVTERWPGSLVIAFTPGSQDVRGEPRPAGVTRLGTACAATRDAVDYGSYATEWMLELARAALVSGSGVEEMQRLQTSAGAAGFRLVALPLGRTDRDPDSVLCELVPSPAAPRFGKRRAWLQD